MSTKKLSWVLWEGDFILEVTNLEGDSWVSRICMVEGRRAVLVWSCGAGTREEVRKAGMRQLRAFQEPTQPDIRHAA